jgi:hypothetical protein
MESDKWNRSIHPLEYAVAHAEGDGPMTAEIAVMNQSAIALAADSAATRSGAKIFAANKIFGLSKYEPVAIMVYGNAACMHVPWETIIKEYRAHLGTDAQPTVDAYGEAFLQFMGKNRDLFPAPQQELFAFESSAEVFTRLRSAIVKRVGEEIEAGNGVGMRSVRRIISTVLSEEKDLWDAAPYKPRASLDPASRSKIRRRYLAQIEQSTAQVFENLPLTKAHRGLLVKIALDSWCNGPQQGLSGVVVAGFGSNEMFPSLSAYELDGVLLDQPVFWYKQKGGMSHQNTAWIVPFAQATSFDYSSKGSTPDMSSSLRATFTGCFLSSIKSLRALFRKGNSRRG